MAKKSNFKANVIVTHYANLTPDEGTVYMTVVADAEDNSKGVHPVQVSSSFGITLAAEALAESFPIGGRGTVTFDLAYAEPELTEDEKESEPPPVGESTTEPSYPASTLDKTYPPVESK